MKPQDPFAYGKLGALTFLLIIAYALAVLGAQAQEPAPQLASLSFASRSDREVALRNRHLLEVNEGIQPVVTTVPAGQGPSRLSPESSSRRAIERALEARYRHFMEVNEGYAPPPFRLPRDQRLYEINR